MEADTRQGRPAESHDLLWRAFETVYPDDAVAEQAASAAYRLWSGALTAGASAMAAYVADADPGRLVGAPACDPVGPWIAWVRSRPMATSWDEAVFALSALTTGLERDEPAELAFLATAHLRRHRRDRDPSDLASAIDILRRVVPRIAHPARVVLAMRRLAEGLDRRGRPDDLTEAASILREVLRRCPPGDAAAVTDRLAGVLLSNYQLTGDLTALDDANELLAVQLLRTDDPDAPATSWSNLGTARYLRFEVRGGDDDLDAAIAAYRRAARLDDSDVTLANLGGVLVSRYERTLDEADIEESVRTLRAVVERTPHDSPELSYRLSNLGASLSLYFDHTGAVEAIDESIEVLRRALETESDTGERSGAAQNLGNALNSRYESLGDRRDLDASIECYEQAVADSADDPRDRPMYLSSLGSALDGRFDAFGDERDSTRAVAVLREAVELVPDGDPNRSTYLNALAQMLHNRFRHRRDPADVEEGIGYAQAAVDALPIGHLNRSNQLNDLGIALHDRFRIHGDPADLDRSAATFREAIASPTPEGRARPAPHTNLGGVLMETHETNGDPATLDAAVEAFRAARHIAVPTDPNLGLLDSNVSEALSLRARLTGNHADAEEAVAFSTRAIAAVDPEHPRMAVIVSGLAAAFAARAITTLGEDSDRRRDADEANRLWQSAVDLTSAPASERMLVALEWIAFTDGQADVEQGAAAHAAAVRLLPLLAWRGLGRSGQERLLVDHADLARRAAARNLTARQPASALEMLEEGRSVLWTQRLDLRSDLDHLAGIRADLAGRMLELRAELDQPGADAT